jgi:hypothetical protein
MLVAQAQLAGLTWSRTTTFERYGGAVLRV